MIRTSAMRHDGTGGHTRGDDAQGPEPTPTTADLARRARDLSQDSNPRDLIAWGILLRSRMGDPQVTAELFDDLGPQETARLLRLTGFAADRTQSFPTEMVETLDALKSALACGTQQMSDARGFADELGRWLLPTELSEEEHDHLLAHGGLPLAGPAVLAQVLLGTDLHPDFVEGIAGRVAHFEQSGKVDPDEYYRRMTPSRFDDYRSRHIGEQVHGLRRR